MWVGFLLPSEIIRYHQIVATTNGFFQTTEKLHKNPNKKILSDDSYKTLFR